MQKIRIPFDHCWFVGHNRISKFLQLVALFVVAFLLSGCWNGNGSRLRHYRSGGAYHGGAPAISPDGRFIVFATPRTGNSDIYRVNFDGTNSTKLTSTEEYDCDPDYSPDGKSIVFIREIDECGQIWIMNADGTDQRPLTQSASDKQGPKFVSDQSIIFDYFDPDSQFKVRRGNALELCLLDIKTKAITPVTKNLVQDASPDASSDGKHYCFVRDFHAYILDRATSAERRVCDGTCPTFSPDGQWLAVVAGKFGRQIDIVKLDGSGLRTIYGRNTSLENPAFLPDGTGVLFLESIGAYGVGKILLVKLDDLTVRTIVDTR